MKNLLLFLFIAPFSICAQSESKGIDFVQKISWEEIKTKAKAENKNILIDCFTSWCGPCKEMERTVFADEQVGKQVNPNFVSLQLQFDIDTLKNPENKERYALSKMFDAKYKIPSFPTILFLDPDGHLLYKVRGLRRTPEFLEITASVSAGEFNYEEVQKRYTENPNDLENLYQLVSLSKRAEKDRVQELLREYLTLNKGIRSQRDAQLVYDVTYSSASYSFGVLKKEQQLINGFLGNGVCDDLIRAIVYYEVFDNKIMRDSPQGRYIREEYPDWSIYEKVVKEKYPDDYTDLMDYIKLNFFPLGHFWDRFTPALSAYIALYGDTVSNKKKVEYATTVAKYIDDKDLVAQTLKWTEEALQEGEIKENLQTLHMLRDKVKKD